MTILRYALLMLGSVCVVLPAMIMSAYGNGAPAPRSWDLVALVTITGWLLLLLPALPSRHDTNPPRTGVRRRLVRRPG